MPQLIAEHSKDVTTRNAIPALFSALMTVCEATDIIAAENVKLRAHGYPSYLVGGEMRPFLHLTLIILTGRSDPQKAELADKLIGAADKAMPDDVEITLDIRDSDVKCFRKRPPQKTD
ncbi:MAG: hypothetical protein WA906_11885 [Pacificimonas sp.]